MKKLRNWIINKALPIYARESLQTEIARLRKENEQLRIKVGRLNAYIDGLEDGIKAQRRIVINTGTNNTAQPVHKEGEA